MHFDIVFLVSSGIGNVIELLYSVEYVLAQPKVKVGLFVEKVPNSFISYLESCYGDVVLTNLEGISCIHLIHSATVEKFIPVPFEHYFYIRPDRYSSEYLSETEQSLSIVRALYPEGRVSKNLQRLKSQAPLQIDLEMITGKTIVYPGCASINPVKRWPYFEELVQKLGVENILIVGGKDDVDFSSSYVYPQWVTAILPQLILNQRWVWKILKGMGLLQKYSHWKEMESLSVAYIEKFSWPELVWIFQHAKQFIGNDGGLTHLAAASGANGFVFYGPTAVSKNKPLNNGIQIISNHTACSPCQFGVGGIQMTKGYINCPFQVKCLAGISVDAVMPLLTKK